MLHPLQLAAKFRQVFLDRFPDHIEIDLS